MSELRNAMHQRANALAASLRDAPEFDEAATRSVIKRRHRNRNLLTSAGGVAAVGFVAVATWLALSNDTNEVVTTPTPSPTASARLTQTPSPTPSPSVTAAPVYEGRNPDMGEEEALERATNPATGESWLAEPEEVNPGEWADDDFFAGYWGAPTWYLVGHRAGNEILSQGRSGHLVEVDESGTPRLIIAPAPYQSGLVALEQDPSVDIDAETYYDSLALPPTATTPEGDVLDLRASLEGLSAELPTNTESLENYGASELLRGTQAPYTDNWGAIVSKALDGAATDVRYFVRLPYGALKVPTLDPLGGEVDWASGYGPVESTSFIDFLDQTCENATVYEVAATPNIGGEWVEAGTVNGRAVLAPAASNELGSAMYENWQTAVAGGLGGDDAAQIGSLSDYLRAPAFIAVETDNPNVWWLRLNEGLSPRYWC